MKQISSMQLAALSSVPPFDQVGVAALRDLAPHVDHLQVPAGTVLARQGRAARELVVVLDGQVEATRAGDVVDHGRAGSLIGADEVLRHAPHEATWTARSDLDVVVVNGPAYRWAAQVVLAHAS
jgi:CRP-like cAMP-binding protein